MADFPLDVAPSRKRRRQPFGAPKDVRLRQLASGAWEVGPTMSDEQMRREGLRLRAYQLWEQAGRPDGRAEEFWLAAETLETEDAEVDTASEDSFPASDPPANTGITGAG